MSSHFSLDLPDQSSDMLEPQPHLVTFSTPRLWVLRRADLVEIQINALWVLVDVALVPNQRLHEFSEIVELLLELLNEASLSLSVDWRIVVNSSVLVLLGQDLHYLAEDALGRSDHHLQDQPLELELLLLEVLEKLFVFGMVRRTTTHWVHIKRDDLEPFEAFSCFDDLALSDEVETFGNYLEAS